MLADRSLLSPQKGDDNVRYHHFVTLRLGNSVSCWMSSGNVWRFEPELASNHGYVHSTSSWWFFNLAS